MKAGERWLLITATFIPTSCCYRMKRRNFFIRTTLHVMSLHQQSLLVRDYSIYCTLYSGLLGHRLWKFILLLRCQNWEDDGPSQAILENQRKHGVVVHYRVRLVLWCRWVLIISFGFVGHRLCSKIKRSQLEEASGASVEIEVVWKNFGSMYVDCIETIIRTWDP